MIMGLIHIFKVFEANAKEKDILIAISTSGIAKTF